MLLAVGPCGANGHGWCYNLLHIALLVIGQCGLQSCSERKLLLAAVAATVAAADHLLLAAVNAAPLPPLPRAFPVRKTCHSELFQPSCVGKATSRTEAIATFRNRASARVHSKRPLSLAQTSAYSQRTELGDLEASKGGMLVLDRVRCRSNSHTYASKRRPVNARMWPSALELTHP